MVDRNGLDQNAQAQEPSRIETCLNACREHFDHILSAVISSQHQEAHQVESSLFEQLMKLGLLLLNLFFVSHHQGDYGQTIHTAQGLATRGHISERSYFSIFGKLKVQRYLYCIGSVSFAPLDYLLNLPSRCYSYFVAERVNLLNVHDAYEATVQLLHKFFALKLSVSAVETMAQESAPLYEAYYEHKQTLPPPEQQEDYRVVSFDGKGVPMIKKEAAKIKGRLGKGEKRQKKKEALVGVTYTVNAQIRTAEEVATNLVFPDRRESTSTSTEKAQHIRYIASIERPKQQVMHAIKKEVHAENFNDTPLICVMDGAKYLWDYFQAIFKEIKNKILILDIIHVLEYLWMIAHAQYKVGSDKAVQYVYDKLLLILQGKVASYILELQNEMLVGSWKKSQKKIFEKVITYLKNHKQYMKYNEYLAQGYPIGSGVVESACNHVVKNRMEVPGARWSVHGAEAILQLRSVVKSQDWDDYWTFYTTQSRKNDFLPQPVNSLNLRQKIPA